MGGVWVYERGGEAADAGVVRAAMGAFRAAEAVRYADSGRGRAALRHMLADARSDPPDAAVLASLASTGDTMGERRAVLESLFSSGAAVLPCDCPHVCCAIEPEANKVAVGGLLDAMSEKVSSSSKKIGRPPVDYHDGWEELYASWRAGDIAASAFMQRAGLKKGTFYNLVSEWDAMWHLDG